MSRSSSIGPSSARTSPRSRISAEQFALAGPSDDPDPAYHAFRKDLADVSLAGRVIASHYAEPVARRIITVTSLRDAPAANATVIAELAPGAPFQMLDDTLGWAWGFAGEERRVGYVESSAVGA